MSKLAIRIVKIMTITVTTETETELTCIRCKLESEADVYK